MSKLPKDFEVELRTKWECPEEGGAPLLTMPNIPKPLQGPGCQPRTILGAKAWDLMRKRAYYSAGYKSEISGDDGSTPGGLHAHEAYDIDYETGTSTFKRVFAITPLEHVYFIHSGRAITLYKQGNPLYSANKLLEGVEHGFQLIYDWNKEHPKEPKLKAYHVFLEYLKHEELAEKMTELIDKYEIEFWGEDVKRMAEWSDWKLMIGKKAHPTPYANYKAWEEAMEKASKSDVIRRIESPFKGGIFDEVAKILEDSKE